MAHVVQLKCPSCGASLQPQSTQCEFCGTALMVVQDAPGQVKQSLPCPHCGKPLGNGAWLCAKCGTPTAGNEERVKELKVKQEFQQNGIRTHSPQLGGLLAPDEYVAFCLWLPNNQYYAVTEKRLLINAKGTQAEYPWSEVVATGNLVLVRGFASFHHKFEVQTLKGSFNLEFPQGNLANAGRVKKEILTAIIRHNMGTRNIQAVIWSLSP